MLGLTLGAVLELMLMLMLELTLGFLPWNILVV